jgi:drug/metabolite transporter (DMT)-like permease
VSAAPPTPARLTLLLALMLSFWSLNYVFGKIALREFPSLLLVGLRSAMAGAFILPIYFWRNRTGWRQWKQGEFGWLLVLGFFGLVLNQLFFVVGLARTSVAHASLGVALAPIIVLLYAAMLGQEHITSRKALGLLIATAGAIILQITRGSGSTATALGDFYILLYGCSFAFFAVQGKDVTKRHGSLTVNTIAYVSGGLALAPITLWTGARFDFSRISAAAWWSLVFMAIFPAVLSTLIFYYALTYIPASRVSAVLYLQPLVATLLAIPTLGEPVTWALAFGGILVLSGVYLTERTRSV